MTRREKPSRNRRLVMLLMAAAVLVPSLFGFGTKFLEFIALYRGDVEGAFAISPILNYLLASLGFLFLFGWAALGGMFRDIEEPKYSMLENEALLDRVDHGALAARFHPRVEGDTMRGNGPAAPRTQPF
jgi:hypothetical protein